ncbi:chaoptin-like [Ochlerotatus camptorhynchus]|uniref:chaoptin-like n=1 Tax=Ochlerotatus camptorhynchus TaxID=644619 RepID=UPI0031DDED17
MARKFIIHIQWILPSVILFVKSITSDIRFPDITSIATKHAISHETMYAVYPNLLQLDMSNQTGFEFPVDQVLLIHDELSRFVCNNCGIHSIYQLSLSKLPQLTHLIMENNSLRYVHPDAFEYNTRMEKISLAGNQLSTFNSEATIRHIAGLAMLDLSWNERFDLNKVELQGTRMFFFTCNHCHTTFLDRNTLARMPRLSQLYLSHNGMERIDDDALMMAKYVKILNVDGNRGLLRLNLKSVSLMKLSAERCSLEGTLHTSKLPLLEYINVRANRITRVNEHGFMQNTNIKVVLLDDNLITKVPTVLLELPLNGLKQLCLDRNPLQPCPRIDEAKTLYSTRSLRKGCLDDGNHLTKFENYLPNVSGHAVYKKMTIHHLSSDGMTVDLSNRAIVYIEPDYVIDDQNVTEVLFDNNHSFDFKPYRVFLNSSRVERMSLMNCSITEIYEPTFKELPNLKSIHLQGNNIKSIDSNSLFTSNPGITFLSLSHNNLEFIAAQSFQTLENLEILHLDWNDRLSNKANTPFLLSTSLRKLSCIHCRFEWLDHMTLARLPNLLELNLENNHIARLDADVLQWTTQLKYLNLRHNHLVAFEPNINQLSHLKTLCLAGSPNFDLEHNKNMDLLDNIQKMMQLDKDCQDEKFSEKLVGLYIKRNKAKHETIDVPKVEHIRLQKFETSSAVLYTSNVAVLVLIGLVRHLKGVVLKLIFL